MNQSWQLIIVGTIVLMAAAYLIQRAVRSWRMSRQGCGGSCGCLTKVSEVKETSIFVPSDEITMRSSSPGR